MFWICKVWEHFSFLTLLLDSLFSLLIMIVDFFELTFPILVVLFFLILSCVET